jgi:hypothetical protein
MSAVFNQHYECCNTVFPSLVIPVAQIFIILKLGAHQGGLASPRRDQEPGAYLGKIRIKRDAY